MAYTKTKDLKNQIDKAIENGVTSKKTLAACLRIALECESRIRNLKEAMNDLQFRVGKAYESTIRYVQDHFTEVVEKDGLYRTDIDLGSDGKFEMKRSKDKLTRIDGSNLTQGFLNDLPKAWTRTKLELNTSAINKANLTEEELEKQNLCREDKFTFSEVTESSENVE